MVPLPTVQARQRLGRKAEILLELLAAGDAVEARIREHSAEVDELMLQLLERRIEAAQRWALVVLPLAERLHRRILDFRVSLRRSAARTSFEG